MYVRIRKTHMYKEKERTENRILCFTSYFFCSFLLRGAASLEPTALQSLSFPAYLIETKDVYRISESPRRVCCRRARLCDGNTVSVLMEIM